jgi:H+-transporting ATPase
MIVISPTGEIRLPFDEEWTLPERASTFDQMKAEEVLKTLDSNLTHGLGTVEVENRLKRYGYNEVPEKKARPLVRFAKKFWGPTPWMLEIIIILSWILQRYSDLYIVTGLLAFNSVLGFIEEHNASKAVESLKEKLHIIARALRDGSWKMVPARELVPGDIVRIRSGDFIPADTKIVAGELEIDQSALTGESVSIERRLDEVLYSGSIVRRGESTGIVVATGTSTYLEELRNSSSWQDPNCTSKKWFQTLLDGS